MTRKEKVYILNKLQVLKEMELKCSKEDRRPNVDYVLGLISGKVVMLEELIKELDIHF